MECNMTFVIYEQPLSAPCTLQSVDRSRSGVYSPITLLEMNLTDNLNK